MRYEAGRTLNVIIDKLLGLILEPLQLALDRVLVKRAPSFVLAISRHGCYACSCFSGVGEVSESVQDRLVRM
jgi:hypothetical protein